MNEVILNDANSSCSRRCLLTWAVLVGVVVILQTWTLPLSPTVWEDEVDIVEYGRVFLDPTTTWSIGLGGENGDQIPQVGLCYLGSTIQEMAYRWSGGSFLGPRFSALLGAVLCSSAALLWLRSRGVAEGLALSVALLLLIDPVFERSYRGGRFDVWPLFCAILACWCVRKGAAAEGRRRVGWLLTAGALAGLLPHLYPTAILLWPLILIEVLEAMGRQKQAVGKSEASTLMLPLAGGLVSLIIPLMPIWFLVIPSAEAIFHHAQWDATKATTTGGGSRNLLSSVIAVLRYSPIWFALAMIETITPKKRLFALGFVGAMLVALTTRFYLYRYVYVLPYMIPLVAAGIDSLAKIKPISRLPQPRWCLTALALLWASLLTFGVRNYVALQEKPWRDHDQLINALREAVGPGSKRVFCYGLDLYYAGRGLGWHMIRPKHAVSPEARDKLYKTSETIIYPESLVDSSFRSHLSDLGFQNARIVSLPGTPGPLPFPTSRYGGTAYGPYVIFFRDAAAGSISPSQN